MKQFKLHFGDGEYFVMMMSSKIKKRSKNIKDMKESINDSKVILTRLL